MILPNWINECNYAWDAFCQWNQCLYYKRSMSSCNIGIYWYQKFISNSLKKRLLRTSLFMSMASYNVIHKSHVKCAMFLLPSTVMPFWSPSWTVSLRYLLVSSSSPSLATWPMSLTSPLKTWQPMARDWPLFSIHFLSAKSPYLSFG